MRASAKDFSQAGFQYLGTPYSVMDCQRFVEKTMELVGIKKDLKGSNAWFREMDWTGTPEECKAVFGSVPDGALLFILENDGGEIARGYTDGLGNASHIGIVTHTGKGAIHSSSSKECVCESSFKDKTIRNGGWNRIGLSGLFDYGDHINALLSGEKEEVTIIMEYAIVTSPDGNPVKLRPTKSTSKPYVAKIPVGTQLLITSKDGEWAETSYDGQTGYIMQKFLLFDGSQDEFNDLPDEIKITVQRATAEALYNALGHALYGGVG